MRQIDKTSEPRSLTTHRARSYSNYENYEDKDDLRAALVAEQRGLCCYCMGRIFPESTKMKIEHWQCISKFPERQLDYRNLLAACLGGEGERRRYEHCDTRKADRCLLWNPADSSHHVESRIAYGTDGSIKSTDVAFDRQLNDDLNLNLRTIKGGRRGSLAGILDWWRKTATGDRSVSRRRLEKRIRQLTDATSMDPYSPVAIWWLRKRLEGFS